jgi:hypothetical protein
MRTCSLAGTTCDKVEAEDAAVEGSGEADSAAVISGTIAEEGAVTIDAIFGEDP